MILDILNDLDVFANNCGKYTSADGGDVIGRPRLNGAGGQYMGKKGMGMRWASLLSTVITYLPGVKV